jgi:hypothetical protein
MLQRLSQWNNRWNSRAWNNTDTVPSGAFLLAIQRWVILPVKATIKAIATLNSVDKTRIITLFIPELTIL